MFSAMTRRAFWAWVLAAAMEVWYRPMACSRVSCTQEPVMMSWKWVNSTSCQAFRKAPFRNWKEARPLAREA